MTREVMWRAQATTRRTVANPMKIRTVFRSTAGQRAWLTHMRTVSWSLVSAQRQQRKRSGRKRSPWPDPAGAAHRLYDRYHRNEREPAPQKQKPGALPRGAEVHDHRLRP